MTAVIARDASRIDLRTTPGRTPQHPGRGRGPSRSRTNVLDGTVAHEPTDTDQPALGLLASALEPGRHRQQRPDLRPLCVRVLSTLTQCQTITKVIYTLHL
jgi:hypothetical protein